MTSLPRRFSFPLSHSRLPPILPSMPERVISETRDGPDAAPELPGPLQIASSFARAVGWLILAAATTKTSALIAPFILLPVSTKAATSLALMTLPFWCLAVAGALGLILKRTWGFYLVYAYIAVSLYGIGIPFLAGFSFFPLLEQVVHLGPLQPYLHLAFNLTVALALLWAHHRLSSADAWLHRPQWVMAVGAIGVVLLAGGLWRQRFHYLNQPLPTVTELPVIGHLFAGFETRGPVEVCFMEHPAANGLIAVFSGMAEGEQIKHLAVRLQLTSIEREEGWKKMLPVLKSWRLSETRFPRGFGSDALHYSGRIPGQRKLQFQLCWRPADQRFCGQFFGIVGRHDAHAEAIRLPTTSNGNPGTGVSPKY